MRGPEKVSREALIAAKGETRAQLARVRRELEAARLRHAAASGLRGAVLARRVNALEAQAERLMAEELRLRLEIDRANNS